MAYAVRLPSRLTSALEKDGFVVEIERERKFLVDKSAMPDLSQYPHKELLQSYFKDSRSGHWIRARRVDGSGERRNIVTIKELVPGGNDDYERREAEHDITSDDFGRLLRLSEGRVLSKTRYYIPHNGHVIELDIYHSGEGVKSLEGLVTAEVEFESMADLMAFVPPDWFGAEVSSDRRYRSRKLAKYGVPADYWENEPRHDMTEMLRK